jgi:hypothetical protein
MTEELQKYIVFYKYAYDVDDINAIMEEIGKESQDMIPIFYKGLTLAGMPDGSEYFKKNWWVNDSQIRDAICYVADYYASQIHDQNDDMKIMTTDEVNAMARYIDEKGFELANKKLFAKSDDHEIKKLENELKKKQKILNVQLDMMERELKEREMVDDRLWVIYRALNKRSFVVE